MTLLDLEKKIGQGHYSTDNGEKQIVLYTNFKMLVSSLLKWFIIETILIVNLRRIISTNKYMSLIALIQ